MKANLSDIAQCPQVWQGGLAKMGSSRLGGRNRGKLHYHKTSKAIHVHGVAHPKKPDYRKNQKQRSWHVAACQEATFSGEMRRASNELLTVDQWRWPVASPSISEPMVDFILVRVSDENLFVTRKWRSALVSQENPSRRVWPLPSTPLFPALSPHPFRE